MDLKLLILIYHKAIATDTKLTVVYKIKKLLLSDNSLGIVNGRYISSN